MKKGLVISIFLHLALLALILVGGVEYFGYKSANQQLEVIETYSVDATTFEPTEPVSDIFKSTSAILEDKKSKSSDELEQKLQAEQEKRLAIEKKIKIETTLREKEKQEKLARENAEKQRQARLAEQERKAAAKLKAELAAAQAEKAKTNSIISKYAALIKQKTENNWRRPADSRSLQCTVKIKLLPDGQVLNAKIKQSSGSNIFDGSVIDALYRAGTFPLPDEPKYRSLFIDDEITMKFTNN